MSTAGRRLGLWSSVALAAVGAGYVVALGVGFARFGLDEPITDPLLSVLEVLTLAAAPAIVVLMAAIHDRAPPARKVHGLVALAFGTLCAGTTGAVHFVELTATRQQGGGGIVWPSPTYAAELLAWDVFLGLALLFAARTFDRRTRERTPRRLLLLGGILCLAGTVGPVVGDMRLQLVGVFGYAAVLPVGAAVLARWFARAGADLDRGRSGMMDGGGDTGR